MRFWSSLFLVVALAAPVCGHELIGPPYVLADLQGHFSYDLTLVVSTTTEFGSTRLDGTDNTDIDVWIDGFCLNAMTPGTSLIEVDGNLVDVSSVGTVVARFALCDGWYGEVATTVMPFPVAEEAKTWGSVKSLYH